ncbi:MAG: hypothetical protein ACKPJF_02345 [Dolichospermum sp.]
MRPSTRLVVLGKKLWTPALISTVLWLDAADASTITLNGSTVSQWNDKSGNGRNAIQATANHQPSYQTQGFNGKPTVTWPNANNPRHLRVNSTTSIQTFICAILYGSGSETTFADYNGLFATNGVTAVIGNQGVGTTWAATNVKTARKNGGASFDPTSTAILPLPAGIVEFTSSSVYTEAWNIGGERFAEVINLSRGFRGLISEVIAFSETPSTTTRQLVEGYLAWKWELTANLLDNHPFKLNPPLA